MERLMEEVLNDVIRLISEKTIRLPVAEAREVVKYVREELGTYLQKLPEEQKDEQDKGE